MPRKSSSKVLRIRELNNAFRSSFRGGKVLMTASVTALPPIVVAEALALTAQFSGFTEENDPYSEHDFGAFDLCGRRFFWKIDCYDKNLEYGSDDPTDPQKTTRILTLMFAEDY